MKKTLIVLSPFILWIAAVYFKKIEGASVWAIFLLALIWSLAFIEILGPNRPKQQNDGS